MAVKVSRLFRDPVFKGFSFGAKLTYIYLVTHPDINSVGVLSLDTKVAAIEVGFLEHHTFKVSVKELVLGNKVKVKEDQGIIYFIIKDHFLSLPKSQAVLKKIKKDLSQLSPEIINYLYGLGIKPEGKIREFIKPSPQEVSEYALEQGYVVDGVEFVSYYDRQADIYNRKDVWVDSRNKEIRDWKAKLRRIWCKEENELQKQIGAPKGFEYFHIKEEGGKFLFPDGWKEGKPFSKSISIDIKLKRKFNEDRERNS